MRKRIGFILLVVLSLSFFAAGIALAEDDVPGSQDHPLLTRMPDFYISQYEVSAFDGFDPTVIGGSAVHWEGKKYSLEYSRKEGGRPVSMLQIVRNYQAAAAHAGGKILGGDERRMAAEIRKGKALTGVYVEAFNDGRSYELTIVESQPMQQDVVADASAMQNDLAATGKTIVPVSTSTPVLPRSSPSRSRR